MPMASLILSNSSLLTRPSSTTFATSHALRSMPSLLSRPPNTSDRLHRFRSSCALPRSGASMASVDDFMTKRDNLLVVKPTTTVDEALELLVENRITGFPVIEDDWKLVGLVSDYDFLAALDFVSAAGSGQTDHGSWWFPEVNSSWETFNEMRQLVEKSNGKVIGEVMTPAPLVVGETTQLHDAARLLLETKYGRLPVVDSIGRLVGIITREDVVRAALVGDKTCRAKKATQN